MSFAKKLKQKIIDNVNAIQEVRTFRLEICNNCPELISSTRQCKECGCFVDLKAALKNTKCPLDKW